jgi:ABC-type phosphate transport system substrate-binding protein
MVAVATVCLALTAVATLPRVTYYVIRNPNNPVQSVDRQFLQDAFLKKKTTWPDGLPLRPIDLAPSTPVRQQFSEEVLRRPVDAVRSYWQQRIFAGRELPPVEVDRDDEVVSFVLHNKGAIGYVSGSATLNGVKILSIK